MGSSPTSGTMDYKNSHSAYIVGVALGDGNLSNPNGRAVRLRITCDDAYPVLQQKIITSLSSVFPTHPVNTYKRKQNCTDIYCYSNELESILGWKAEKGSKEKQQVRLPGWIFSNKEYMRNCLCGLIETDGSVYKDRKYTYVNFTSIIRGLAQDVMILIDLLGYSSTIHSTIQKNGKRKFVVRVCKRSLEFIEKIGIQKK